MIGIYKITNPKGCSYIGSSIEIEVRLSRYKKLLCKSQPKLYNSLAKYGVENHTFDVLEECSVDKLYERENYYGLLHNVLDREMGLNLILPNIGDVKFLLSEENLKNRSLAQLGKKASLETRLKQRESQLGRKHSINTRNKMRENNKNVKIVLNLETGIFYIGTKEAADSHGLNRHTLKNKLNGSKPNNSQFVYV